MGFDKGSDRDRRRKSKPGSSEGSAKRTKAAARPAPEVGDALRSVYNKALNEDIPPEMLDLLGKLG